MKALLTGGAGYIGSHTAIAMLEAGHEVAVVDNYYNSSPEAIRRVEQITGKSIALYEADVADKDKMREILAGRCLTASYTLRTQGCRRIRRQTYRLLQE